MPLPLILGAGAAVAAAAGIGTGIHGAKKMKEANDTMKSAERQHERNIARFEKENKTTSEEMDKLGKLELEILHSFSSFADVFEQIKNRPIFENYTKNGILLPKYDGEKLKEVSIGAGVLLGGLGGAGLGAAGGFAAAGATTAAVMALGTASTGTAIASLSGAALTNATLAALGGGAIAAGGGGIALGTTILGATTLGVGLLVGGVIFSFTGGKLSDKADEAWAQMKKAEAQIDKICRYLVDLRDVSDQYYHTISSVNDIYQKHLNSLVSIVTMLGHKDWDKFSDEEKKITENTVLLVGLLYNMCKVELVLKAKTENDTNIINRVVIRQSMNNASAVLADKFPEIKVEMGSIKRKVEIVNQYGKSVCGRGTVFCTREEMTSQQQEGIKYYAKEVGESNRLIALYDASSLCSGKKGLVFAEKAIYQNIFYGHNFVTIPREWKYGEIAGIEKMGGDIQIKFMSGRSMVCSSGLVDADQFVALVKELMNGMA